MEQLLEFKRYLLVDKKYSKQTISSYISDINIFLSHITIPFDKIQKKDIINYIKNLKDKNYMPKTINRNISVLKSFYKFLIIEKYINVDPTENLESFKVGTSLPNVLNYDEVKLILDIDLVNEYSYRDKAMLELMYATGLRVSELIDLKVASYDNEMNIIKTLGKGSKERIIPVGEIAAYYLNEYISNHRSKLIKNNTDCLFLNNRGTKLSRQSFFNLLKLIAIKKNINKNFSPHTLRHSFATHLLDRGADIVSIKELLGHSSLSTTQIYTNLSNQTLREQHKKFHPHG